MKIKSSDGRVIKVPANFQARAKSLMDAGNHSGMEALYKEIESESFKKGGMLKRKDGSYSRRGLWDNIRANKGSGKKPTKQMLEQERKIRAKHAAGGTVFKGYVTEQPISEPVPFHTSTIGEKMGKGGYTVKRSSARKGKTHVVIGPDGTKKYFGDSKLGQHPKDPARKKSFYARHAKNLKGNPYFRAFARATWADGGKLGQGIYDMGLMPYGMGGHTQEGPMSQLYAPHTGESVDIRYADGGYIFAPKMDYDGRINVPYGYNTPAYNERYQMGKGGFFNDVWGGIKDVGLYGADNVTSLINQDIIKDSAYSDTGFGRGVKGASHITGSITNSLAPMAATAIGGPMAGMAVSAAQQASGSFVKPDQARLQSNTGAIGQGVGSALGIASSFYNPLGGAAQAGTAGNLIAGSPSPLNTMMAMHGGYVHMADGGQTGLVPINVEGANFSSGSGPNAKKGELLVLNGKIIKNYVGRPPHPSEGQNPMGNDDAPEGLIVIPKARTAEYLEAGLMKRKQIEKSLVSQQQDREMKKSRKMGDGGYYSFGMGEMGMGDGGPIGNPETINDITYGTMKKGGWIQKATASIKRRGTEGVCTGSKFGSSSCPPGSRRYNLAKTFRKMARSKNEHGGFVDPVTGQIPNMYAAGGQLPEGLLRTRMRASGASPEEINSYVAAKYEMGGPTNVDRSAIYAGMRSRFNYGGRAMMQTGAVVSPEQTSMAGTYPALGNWFDPTLTGMTSYSYYDPSAENYDPNMTGWYGYKDGVPTSITDANWINALNSAYMPPSSGNSYGQSNSNVPANFNYSGPGSVARMQNPQNWNYTNNESGLEGWKGTPYAYPANTPGGTTPPPASNSSYLDPDVRRAMRAYGIAGGIYGGAQIGEGLLSKPETYKRMPLRREKPELLNPREALADVTRTMAGYKYAGRQTGPNQRNFLTSLASKDAAARAGIYGQYDNANAQIRNAYKDALVRDQMALMQQDQYAQMFDAQARAARRNMIRSGLGDLAGTAGNYANMAIQNKYLGRMAGAGDIG